MVTSEISLPVHLAQLFLGLARALGILKTRLHGLSLEWEIKESVFKTWKLGSSETHIPYSDLSSIDFEAGWFKHWITLRTGNLRALHGIPGSAGCELRLRVARRDKAAARELVSAVNLELQSQSMQKMIQQLENPPRLLP